MSEKRSIGFGFIGLGIISIVILAVLARPTVSAGLFERQILNSSEALAPPAASIEGTVTADGRPLPEAEVFLAPVGSHRWQAHILTDDSGRFELKGLARRAYNVMASYPGYVMDDVSEVRQYRYVGDVITIHLAKGGVLTGKVTDEDGDPIVFAQLRAKPAPGEKLAGASLNRDWAETDDRGIYRIFGLEPGSYVVALTSIGERHEGWPDDQTAIYHPSSSRDGATKVTVGLGEEATAIDIHFQKHMGRTIRGVVQGASVQAGSKDRIEIKLLRSPTGEEETRTAAGDDAGSHSFKLSAVSDGEYLLRALYWSDGKNQYTGSASRAVTVNGKDIAGADLTLIPYGYLAGRVVLEPSKEWSDCKTVRPLQPEELVLTVARAGNQRTGNKFEESGERFSPNEQGVFEIPVPGAGDFVLQANLPERGWYLQSIADKQSAGKSTYGPLSIKSGERRSGLTITLSPGAASIAGHVILPSQSNRTAKQCRLLLVPAEKPNDLTRYVQAPIRNDGTFYFANVAPGKYKLAALDDSDPRDDSAFLPAPVSVIEMAAIQKAAANEEIVDVKPCSKVTGFEFRPKAVVDK
jgi:hypothetical protein